MLIVTDGGEGVLVVPDAEHRMTQGTITLSPAGVPHRFTVVREPWTIAWFYLADSPLWRRLAGGCAVVRNTSDAPSFLAACEGFILEYHRLEHEPRGGALRNRSLSVCALREELVLAYLDRYVDLVCSDGGGRDARIRALLSRVRRQPGDRWSVNEMARTLDVSHAQLTREVKELTGRTPWQEVIRIRMELAADLLARTDYPLKLIASRVGYSDAFVLSSAFKHHYGVSPDTYRRRVGRNSNPPELF